MSVFTFGCFSFFDKKIYSYYKIMAPKHYYLGLFTFNFSRVIKVILMNLCVFFIKFQAIDGFRMKN